MKSIKTFETFKTVNLSDLRGNMSAEYHINKDNGKDPYTKTTGGLLVKVEAKKSIPKTAIYITSEQAKKYNKITEEINKLKEEQKNIL